MQTEMKLPLTQIQLGRESSGSPMGIPRRISTPGTVPKGSFWANQMDSWLRLMLPAMAVAVCHHSVPRTYGSAAGISLPCDICCLAGLAHATFGLGALPQAGIHCSAAWAQLGHCQALPRRHDCCWAGLSRTDVGLLAHRQSDECLIGLADHSWAAIELTHGCWAVQEMLGSCLPVRAGGECCQRYCCVSDLEPMTACAHESHAASHICWRQAGGPSAMPPD